jgi:uncharacterized protein
MRRLEAAGTRVIHSVQTNGMLIDEAWCDFFRDYNIRVGVSIDGPQWLQNAHRVDRRGRGTFARAMAGVEHLRAAGVPFSIITVLTNNRVDRPDDANWITSDGAFAIVRSRATIKLFRSLS